MCGIAGFVDSDRHAAGSARVDTEFNLVHRMCEVIRHRGPDDEGMLAFDGAGIVSDGFADSWIDVKGNGYGITGNQGTDSPADARGDVGTDDANHPGDHRSIR